jgi:hypothetical protein
MAQYCVVDVDNPAYNLAPIVLSDGDEHHGPIGYIHGEH